MSLSRCPIVAIFALSFSLADAAYAQQPAPLPVPMEGALPGAPGPAEPVEPAEPEEAPPARAPAPATPSSSAASARDGYPLAGYRGGRFYLRDTTDNFRLYPSAMLLLDADAWAGKGVADVRGSSLRPRLAARAARLGLGGQVLDGIDWLLVFAADGQSLSNPSGTNENRAAAPGEAPDTTSARYASAQTPGNAAGILDAWVNFRALPVLNVMVGQYRTPFTMQNTTPLSALPFHERPLTSSFGMPGARDIGATLWGDVRAAGLSYYVGAYEGDGKNRPGVDARADLMARVTWQPLAKLVDSLKDFRIGASIRGGSRDGTRVEYDYPAMSTQQGFVFWQPVYRDALGRWVHVVPADQQRAIAFELWVPWKRLDVQSELVLLKNRTREAVEGFQTTNTERIGTLEGAAGYLQVGYTLFGAPRMMGAAGRGVRPISLDFTKPAPLLPPQSLELLVRAEVLGATYSGASRGGVADTSGGLDGKIKARSLGLGVNYWASRHARISANWIVYSFPGSGTPSNRAVAPGQLASPARAGAHVMHELGLRFGVML